MQFRTVRLKSPHHADNGREGGEASEALQSVGQGAAGMLEKSVRSTWT
jgi:hypothetical protein